MVRRPIGSRDENRRQTIQRALNQGVTLSEDSDLTSLLDVARKVDCVVCVVLDPTKADGFYLHLAKGEERFQAMMRGKGFGDISEVAVMCASMKAAERVERALVGSTH